MACEFTSTAQEIPRPRIRIPLPPPWGCYNQSMSTNAQNTLNAAEADNAPSVHQAVLQIIRRYWGFEQLRPLQADAIAAALAGRDSLVVLPTGGGKSLCYQTPPAVSGGTDVVISPLISL